MKDNFSYLEQAEAHSEEGKIGEAAAHSILAIAMEATLACQRLAQTIYIHLPESEIRKSLGDELADYVLSRRGAPAARAQTGGGK